MKSVLISIQPKWCELIVNGAKTVEIRKTRPNIETPFKCYIYCTLPKKSGSIFLMGDKNPVQGNGYIIGEFVCDEIVKHTPTGDYYMYYVDDDTLEAACLTVENSWQYGKGRPLFAWHISNLVVYDKPKELSEFFHYKKFDWWDYGRHTNKPQWELCSLTRPPQSWCYVED